MVGVKYSPYDPTCRKERKPIVEKLRRERMNNSISQLKDLICTTIQRHAPPMSRVDKADILEYAVIHLQQLQQQQTVSGSSNANVSQFYDAGFKDCAREAVTFLSNSRLADDNTVNDISHHLHTVNMRRKEPSTGSRAKSTSGLCLSTPIRSYKTWDIFTENGRFAADCSPIQRRHFEASQQKVTSIRPPEVASPRLGDLSLNTVLNILDTPDTSSSDVSMNSKETSSIDSDSFCSRRLSYLFDSPEKFPIDMSLDSVFSVIGKINSPDESRFPYADAPAGDGIGISREVTDFNTNGKGKYSGAPWRPW